jgi:pimeloyl-ACP methyl ester carboxylesterase
VTTPSLLVRGGLSIIISAEDLERVRSEMPDARAVDIPDAHHHVPLDAPEALALAVERFAAELPA